MACAHFSRCCVKSATNAAYCLWSAGNEGAFLLESLVRHAPERHDDALEPRAELCITDTSRGSPDGELLPRVSDFAPDPVNTTCAFVSNAQEGSCEPNPSTWLRPLVRRLRHEHGGYGLVKRELLARLGLQRPNQYPAAQSRQGSPMCAASSIRGVNAPWMRSNRTKSTVLNQCARTTCAGTRLPPWARNARKAPKSSEDGARGARRNLLRSQAMLARLPRRPLAK